MAGIKGMTGMQEREREQRCLSFITKWCGNSKNEQVAAIESRVGSVVGAGEGGRKQSKRDSPVFVMF